MLYPCGHNIVIYNLDDKSQVYIPGVEGSEGITTLALSPSRRFLAVCERAEKALCLIYDLSGINQIPPLQPRRRKILTSQDYNSKEFISACFSPINEKGIIATLTCPYMGKDDKGQSVGLVGESKVILWVWEKSRCSVVTQI